MTILTTKRLTLRPPEPGDAAALVRGLNNFNVAQWTGRVPHPYGLDDASAYIAHCLGLADKALGLLITQGGRVIGGIGIEGELGYWLAEPYWSQGFGTEAARAVVDHAFTVQGHTELEASYQLGNAASRRILLGLGFVETGESTGFSKARQMETRLMLLSLTRVGWQEARERRR